MNLIFIELRNQQVGLYIPLSVSALKLTGQSSSLVEEPLLKLY